MQMEWSLYNRGLLHDRVKLYLIAYKSGRLIDKSDMIIGEIFDKTLIYETVFRTYAFEQW